MPTKSDQPQCLGNGGEDERRVADGGKRHEMDTIGERTGEASRDVEGEPGLAHAAGTGQGQQANVVPPKETADRGEFPLAPDERRERDRKRIDLLAGLRGGHDACAPSIPMIAASIVENVT